MTWPFVGERSREKRSPHIPSRSSGGGRFVPEAPGTLEGVSGSAVLRGLAVTSSRSLLRIQPLGLDSDPAEIVVVREGEELRVDPRKLLEGDDIHLQPRDIVELKR